MATDQIAHNILLIQLKRIGDIVLTAPVVTALKKKFPSTRITMVLDAAFSSISEVLPADEYMFFDKRSHNAALWKSLFFGNWDFCLEFTGTDRGTIMTAASHAKVRSTYRRHFSLTRRLFFNCFVDADVKLLHTVDYHLALAVNDQTISECSLKISESLTERVSKKMSSAGVSSNFAVIHPGSARAEKMWCPEKWALLVRLLREQYDLDVVLTGGNDPLELSQIESVSKLFGGSGLFSFAGDTTLSELAAILAKARVFVGVDTGASHIADSFGVPSVVLYGNTNPRHWGPRGRFGRAVGCDGWSSYPHNFPRCEMRDIPLEYVVSALKEALAR